MRAQQVRPSLDASTVVSAVATAAVVFLAIIGVGSAIGGEAEAGPTPSTSAVATKPSPPPCTAMLALVGLREGTGTYRLTVDHRGDWTVSWPSREGDTWQPGGEDEKQRPAVAVEDGQVLVRGKGDKPVEVTVKVAADRGVTSIPAATCASP
ncbi:hypothetical protein [Phytohabitans kaempferiae]|uniref:Uncharacterized protein n=1 Tax=Phytohabitans kaempferiae TaxID=1620943 RepID=A0ABV6LUZ3_9ACTN